MTENTVFVVGAGASKEANLPTGYELKSQIANLLDMRYDDFGSRLKHGDATIAEALRSHTVQSDDRSNIDDMNSYLVEAWHIRDALPQAISIDNFIDTHRDNDKIALCGKLAIVRSILAAEKRSLLYFEKERRDSTLNFNSLEKTWYIPFFQLLTENCVRGDIEERFKSITLIVFNYDRCIEHYICHALQNYYKLTEEESAELIKNINIYHPYGDVGTLPWVDRNEAVEFGAELNSVQLLKLSHKIKTFTEGTNPESSEILEIRKHMGRANRVVFLGFAFHKLNMQLISPNHDDAGNSVVKCFATTFGISKSDEEVIDEQLQKLYDVLVKVNMANLPCGGFFTEYWRSLSF